MRHLSVRAQWTRAPTSSTAPTSLYIYIHTYNPRVHEQVIWASSPTHHALCRAVSHTWIINATLVGLWRLSWTVALKIFKKPTEKYPFKWYKITASSSSLECVSRDQRCKFNIRHRTHADVINKFNFELHCWAPSYSAGYFSCLPTARACANLWSMIQFSKYFFFALAAMIGHPQRPSPRTQSAKSSRHWMRACSTLVYISWYHNKRA